MEQPLVLTFDIGTQSVRCLLVRPDGSFADVEQQKYDVPYYSANPGWAEQTPDFYYEQICDVAKKLCDRSRSLLPQVIAVTLTCIRDTIPARTFPSSAIFSNLNNTQPKYTTSIA